MGGKWRVRDKLYSCPYCKKMGGFLVETKPTHEVWRCSKCLKDTSKIVYKPSLGGAKVNKGEGVACLRYGRISRASERSLAEQKQDEATRMYYERSLAHLGYRDAGFWFDEDVSAAKVPFLKRKYARDLFEQSRPGDIIVAQYATRTFRSLLDTGITLETLNQRGVSLFLMDAPWDLSTDAGKAMASMFIAFGEMEIGFQRDRMINDKAARIKSGRPFCGLAPTGWKVETVAGEKVYVPDEEGRAKALSLLAQKEAGRHVRNEIVPESGHCAATVFKMMQAARDGFPHPKDIYTSPEAEALREKKRRKKRLRRGKAFLDGAGGDAVI